MDVPVPKQPELHGSTRAYRGSAIRVLGATFDHALGAGELRRRVDAETSGPALADDAWDRIIAGLARDRLVHRSGDLVRLGAATIRR